MSSPTTPTGTFNTTTRQTPKQQILYLKACHQWAIGDTRDKMIKEFGRLVNEYTEKSVELYYYPNQALFKARDQWDALRTGALDMAVLPLDYASGKVPELSLTLLPCMLTSIPQGLTWKDKEVGQSLDKFMLDNYRVRHVIWSWSDGSPGSKLKQIVIPSDLAGVKIRAAGRKFEFMCLEAGAQISSIPSAEIYYALTTGVLDSAFTSSSSFLTFHLEEQLDFMNVPRDNAMWFMEEGVYMSERSFDKMVDWQKDAFLQAAKEIQDNWVPANLPLDTQRLVDVFGQRGVELHYMTKDEWDQWKEFGMATSWKNFVETTNDGQRWLDMAIDAST